MAVLNEVQAGDEFPHLGAGLGFEIVPVTEASARRIANGLAAPYISGISPKCRIAGKGS